MIHDTAGGVSAAGKFWRVPPQWPGESVFVIAGGPSVKLQKIESLRGRRVIVINSSCDTAPWADYLFFMDARVWRKNRAGVDAFQGQLVTTSAVPEKRALRLHKRKPEDGFASDPGEVMGRRTTLSLVLNAIAHMGGRRRVVLLGADGKMSAAGERNHYEPLAAHRPGTFEDQRAELALTVKPLEALGIEVFNASPGSALPFWPIVNLEDVI